MCLSTRRIPVRVPVSEKTNMTVAVFDTHTVYTLYLHTLDPQGESYMRRGMYKVGIGVHMRVVLWPLQKRPCSRLNRDVDCSSHGAFGNLYQPDRKCGKGSESL